MPRWGLVRTQFLLQSIHFNGNNKRQFRSNINDWPLPPIQNRRLIYRSRDTARTRQRPHLLHLLMVRTKDQTSDLENVKIRAARMVWNIIRSDLTTSATGDIDEPSCQDFSYMKKVRCQGLFWAMQFEDVAGAQLMVHSDWGIFKGNDKGCYCLAHPFESAKGLNHSRFA